MSRFAPPARVRPGFDTTENLAGGEAFTRPLKEELAVLVVNSMVQDTYYETAETQLKRLAEIATRLSDGGNLKFCAQAALYTRHEHGLRSISHALAGEVARLRYGNKDAGDWGARFFQKIVFRLDDMLEIAGYWLSVRSEVPGDPTQTNIHLKKTLPSAMKRGFARVFEKANRNLLAKWDGKATRSLTLRQLAHLVHPTGEQGSPVYALRGGTLKAADTHEVKMTRVGQVTKGESAEVKATAKKLAWYELLENKKMKYLACLRNCVRIIEEAPNATSMLVEKLISLKDIRGSKVLPFQIAVAAKQVSQMGGVPARAVMEALSTAITLSLDNVPSLPGSTLVVVDESGSMSSRMVAAQTPLELASLFAAVLLKKNENCDLMLFAENARYCTVNQHDSVITIAGAIGSQNVPRMTDFSTPFRLANREYDRIIILSDEQGWVGYNAPTAHLAQYEQRCRCKPRVYMWNLTGTATCTFPSDRVSVLGGFSAKALETIGAIETDPLAMIHDIEAVEI